MLMAPVRYVRPDSVGDALEALEGEDGARVLAGGQSLVNALKLRAARVELLVDITRLAELSEISREPDGSLVVGAAATYVEVERSADVARALPLLQHIAAHLVDRQVRNRGTVGGNCCLNDPLSNLPPLFVAIGARFRIAGRDGLREVDADDFFTGPYQTAVRHGELLHSVVVPPLAPDTGLGYQSLQLGAESWALARAAVCLVGDPISSARVVLGCIGPRPLRQPDAEERLIGRRRADVDLQEVERATAVGIRAFGDVHASGKYRLAMAKTVAGRAVAQAIGTEGTA